MKQPYLFAAIATALLSAVAAADDMVTLRDNIVRQLTAAAPTDSVAEHVAQLKPDGSFADLDYTPNPLTNQPFKHIGRLHDMVVAWACPTHASYQDAKLKAALLKAYEYWVARDIQHRNWWFNEIGVPDSLSETMLILQKHDALPAGSFRKAITVLDRARPRQDKLSAANLVWTAYATRNEGVLSCLDAAATETDKAAASLLVKQSFERIGSTIKFTTSDGINADYSFHAHGPMPYNGGYGQAWLGDTARIAASAAGTGYGIAPDRVRLIIDYVLNGDQFMTRGLNYDLAVTGRDWSRATHTATAGSLRTAVGNLMAIEPVYRAAEMKALKVRLDKAAVSKAADPADAAAGNRSFYTSDYMTHQRDGYLFSVKTTSKRTSLPEAMNGENGKGGLAYDGLNLLYRTGNEYNDIQPLWDWYRLPGTTSERAVDGTGGTYEIKPPTGKRGTTTVAGGASDGMIGTHAFQFSRYNITANKSWFFFDRGEVAMGNSIAQAKPSAANGVVGTNINQTLLNGDVVYSIAPGQSTRLADGQSVTPKGLRWVHHDGVGYVFLDPATNATVRNVARTGAWTDINLGGYSAETFTSKLFDLDLNHGPTPTATSYAYAVIPGLRADEMNAFLEAEPFTVLRNDAVAQAVTDNTNTASEVNFYAAGDVQLKEGMTLSLADTKRAASVLLKRTPGKIMLSVASPEHWTGELTLRLSGRYTGNSASWDATNARTTVIVTLPDGPAAGGTVTQTLTAVP